MRYAYRDLLAGSEGAHAGRVAGVELALACLNTAGAAEEWMGVHHHIIAGNVSEVEVVHLVERDHKIHTRLRGVIKTSSCDQLKD